jgi:AcrR family transcriptional regulator
MAYRATEKTRKHKEDLQQKILSVARDTVAEGGFAAVHMSSIAAAAGLATGTLYRHFPSKAELLAEVFRRVTKREVLVMSEIAASGGAAAPRLTDALEVFARRALQSPVLAYALIFEPVGTLVDSERLVFRRSYAEVLGRIIEDGITSGEFPAQNTAVVANCMVGALAEALIGPLAADPKTTSGERSADIQAIVSFCLNAVTGHPQGAIT